MCEQIKRLINVHFIVEHTLNNLKIDNDKRDDK